MPYPRTALMRGMSLLIESNQSRVGSEERAYLEQLALQHFQMAAYRIRRLPVTSKKAIALSYLDFPNQFPTTESGWIWIVAASVREAVQLYE